MSLISKGLSRGRSLLGPSVIGKFAVRLGTGQRGRKLPMVEMARGELSSLSAKPDIKTGFDFAFEHPAEVDLSIIVPCYNVERYVGDCLDSILSQDATCTFEVVAVNDGSIDGTSQILERYASNDARVRVIHQKNRGFSGARNVGIDNARGRVLMFVDSDDAILPRHIANLWTALEESGADIVSGRYRKMTESGKVLRSVEKHRVHGGPCARLYKRDVWSDVRFPEGFWFEDTVQAYCIDSRFEEHYVDDAGYCYRMNAGSITSTCKASYKSLDSYWIVEEMLDWCRGLGIDLGQGLYDQTLHQFGPLILDRTSILNDDQRAGLFVLCSNLINTTEEFDGLRTSLGGRWRDLEASLRDGDYSKWLASCKWIG